ncbi:hypothetical protein AVEN_207349-1 [Araneus ventricosus]|uniref:Uncharacterized protein n=1 Tax=Araneus ventricosus TaxID=182803 RepID=A0A4Y2QEL7_ARAVE|nr:hypothetical protein AVEN_253792-1 [Araneus ventricosus]GBN61137.1 hypothetical protein AVEN_87169-1 [Araneus ventricosus]GBN61143.1 hypothetical protein AVEN_91789-1 [Araneus ventricosus]GBN61175.1 hypothetical protein AVEN_207349-1 [Araneus ventricosus]
MIGKRAAPRLGAACTPHSSVPQGWMLDVTPMDQILFPRNTIQDLQEMVQQQPSLHPMTVLVFKQRAVAALGSARKFNAAQTLKTIQTSEMASVWNLTETNPKFQGLDQPVHYVTCQRGVSDANSMCSERWYNIEMEKNKLFSFQIATKLINSRVIVTMPERD